MIVDLGARCGSIVSDDESARFEPAFTHEVRLLPSQTASGQRRAVVELRRFHGGLAPHGIIGAGVEPGGETLLVQVCEGTGGAHRRMCQVRLGGRRLIPGLPSDLVEPVVSGLARTLDVGPGIVLVDRAGFDPVEASPVIMELAAEILGRVLSLPPDQSVAEGQLREWLLALP